jgi:GNAT superfamily N-acetyltransferase
MQTVELEDGREVVIDPHRADEPRQLVVTATTAAGNAVGLAAVDIDPSATTGHLTVTVAHAWQGVGLGRELLERATALAGESGLSYVVGSYPAANVAAARLVAGSQRPRARRVRHGMTTTAFLVGPPVPQARAS